MLKELHVIQQHHRSNKNTPADKIFTEKEPHTCADCNLAISLQKNLKFKCAINLHNVSNASFCFLAFTYLKMYKILYHYTALYWQST